MDPRLNQDMDHGPNQDQRNIPQGNSISLGDIKNSTEIQKQLVCYLAFRFKNKPRDWKCVIRDWEIRDLNPENAADREYLRHLVYNYTKPGSRHGPPGHLCQFYKKCMEDAMAITHPIKHIFKDITMYVSNEEKMDNNQRTPTIADRKRKTSNLNDNQSCMTNEVTLTTRKSTELPGPAPKKADTRTQKTSIADKSTDNINLTDAAEISEEVFCVSDEKVTIMCDYPRNEDGKQFIKKIEVKNTYTFVKNNIFEVNTQDFIKRIPITNVNLDDKRPTKLWLQDFKNGTTEEKLQKLDQMFYRVILNVGNSAWKIRKIRSFYIPRNCEIKKLISDKLTELLSITINFEEIKFLAYVTLLICEIVYINKNTSTYERKSNFLTKRIRKTEKMIQSVKNWEIEIKSKDEKCKNAAGFNLRKAAKKLRCSDENPKVILNQLREKIAKFNRGLLNMEIRKRNSVLASRFGHKPSMKTLNFLKSSNKKQKSELDNKKARTFYSNLARQIPDSQRKKTAKIDEFIDEIKKHRANVKNEVNFDVIKEAFNETIKFTAPWKAPGPDCISGYAWKHFDCLKAKLFDWILKIIKGEELIKNTDCTGVTYLLFKKGDKKDPSNYRPITCLGVHYKILTACISKYLLNFLKMNPEISDIIFPSNQIAGRKNVRSTTYAHLIDKAIQLDKKYSIQKKGDKLNLYMGYVDFKKAYDSVHKDIILKILENSGIDNNIYLVLKQIMSKWRTTISMNGKTLKPYTIGRGVLQGDSMSPLLFIFSISSISWFMNKEKKVSLKRNQLMYSQKPFNHLFYMDDLKFYTDDSKELKKFFNLTKNIAKEIGLSMNTNKSAKIESIDKELDLNELNDLQNDIERNEFIPEVFDTYTYLGIDQKRLDNSKISLKRISDKVNKITSELFKSDLGVRQKVQGFNTICIPVINYIAANMFGNNKFESTLNAIKTLLKDKVIKILLETKIKQKNNLRERSFLPVEKGGLGLKDPVHEYKLSHVSTALYLIFEETLRGITQNWLSWSGSGKRTILKDLIHILKEVFPNITLKDIKINYNDNVTSLEIFEYKWVDYRDAETKIKELLNENYINRLYKDIGENNYFGKYYKNNDTDFAVLKANLSNVMVRSFLAITENQVLLKTHPVNAHLKNKSCRLCQNSDETLTHVLTSCSQTIGNFGKERHDKVTRVLWKELIKKFGFKYIPKNKIYENENVKILWDFKHEVENKLYHTKPDITIINKVDNKVILCETAISMYELMKCQQEIKKIRYTINGEIEINHLNYKTVKHGDNLKNILLRNGFNDVTFIPLIVSTSGEIMNETKAEITQLLGKNPKHLTHMWTNMGSNALAVSHRMLKRVFAHKNPAQKI